MWRYQISSGTRIYGEDRYYHPRLKFWTKRRACEARDNLATQCPSLLWRVHRTKPRFT
jgi:hypothetical protein